MQVEIITFSCNYCFNIIEPFKLCFSTIEKYHNVPSTTEFGRDHYN